MSTGLKWFKCPLTYSALLDDLADDQAGAIFKALLQYARTGEAGRFSDPETAVTFKVFRAAVDESLAEYAARQEDGRRGAAAKQAKKEQAGLGGLSDPAEAKGGLGGLSGGEGIAENRKDLDKDLERQTEREDREVQGRKEQITATSERPGWPSFDEVKAFFREKGVDNPALPAGFYTRCKMFNDFDRWQLFALSEIEKAKQGGAAHGD